MLPAWGKVISDKTWHYPRVIKKVGVAQIQIERNSFEIRHKG